MILLMAETGDRSSYSLPDGVVIAVVAVVALVWAVSQLAPLWVKGFAPAPEVSFGFMGIVASIFGTKFFVKGGA